MTATAIQPSVFPPFKGSSREVWPVHPATDLFPMMKGAEFNDLVEDIRQHGLRVPMVRWTDPADGLTYLLDGRNRMKALIAIGGDLVAEYFADVGDCDPYAYAISANIHRRHLTAEQKRDLIAKLLKAQPEKSNRQIAGQAKVSHVTVGAVRSELEGRGQIVHVESITDTKGRQQPVRRSLYEKMVAKQRAEKRRIERDGKARKLPEPAPESTSSDDVESLPVHARPDGLPTTVGARWRREADAVEIAGCILGTLAHEPHDNDIGPLRRALEAFIAQARTERVT